MRPAPANVRLLAVVGVVLIAGGAWLLVRRAARVDLARYAPESAMLFVQIDSLPDLAGGLSSSDAWRRAAPALGLSAGLPYAGSAAEALAQLGIGPDDAATLARAQLGVVVTSVEATAQTAAEGGETAVEIRPHFALLVETHLPERTVAPTAGERLPAFARRAYGDAAAFESSTYGGTDVTTARAPAGGRQMAWAVRGGLVVVGNHEDAVRAVLDAASGRAPTLAANFYMSKVRPEVHADGALVFGFVSQAGVGRLVGLAPGAIAGTLTADPDRATTVARLFAGMSERTVAGVGYSGRFEKGRFVDRYFAIPGPGLAEALPASVRPAARGDELAALVPAAAEVTVARVERPGDAADALLAAVSSRVDVSVSATLAQVGVELRRQYGVVPDDPVGPSLGDELAFVDFGGGAPMASVFEVRDQSRLLATVERYLRADGARITSETAGGTELLRSSREDGRAAAFLGRYLVLGTRDQILRMADERREGRGSEPLRALLRADPDAVLLSLGDDRRDTSELLVALAGHVGPPDQQPAPEVVAAALEDLPPSTSATTLRAGGVYVENRSAVGSLSLITLLL